MLSLNAIKPTAGSRKTSKRVGRGNASKGTFSGRGMNGQNARSGGGVAPWFEGGQTPLFRRMPKLKGFSNANFKKEYNVINLKDIEILASKGITEIDKKVLLENKVIKKKNLGVKLLAKGELKTLINITVDKASGSAIKAVEKAGGKIEVTGIADQTDDARGGKNEKKKEKLVKEVKIEKESEVITNEAEEKDQEKK